jgi:DNA-binding NarL/FixJ family response regulator
VIRLVLVDDQELVRAGLRLILSAEDDLEVVGEARDGRAGVYAARTLTPDVVLMDVRMPVMDGIEATRRLAADGDQRVLALTTFEDDEVLWGIIEAGAAGFVLKDAPAADLVGAIRVTARGGSWLDPTVADRVLTVLRRQPGAVASAAATPVDPLTEREREVLRLVASGANNAEIAESLYLSERTVKGHISAIFAKLGVRDRPAAIIRAYDAGIVTPRA